jgi:predicted metal-dependent HD superfamily phosphohydrolase
MKDGRFAPAVSFLADSPTPAIRLSARAVFASTGRCRTFLNESGPLHRSIDRQQCANSGHSRSPRVSKAKAPEQSFTWPCCPCSPCRAWTASPVHDAWQLQQHYQEPRRHYHTLAHLAQCLEQLDAAKAVLRELNVTEMAIWFHDVIYRYGAGDNETLSAAFFRERAAPQMPAEFVERVCAFIVATQHTGKADDIGIAFMVNIDLSGFGLPWEDYLADSDTLREEAPATSDEHDYQGKLRYLSELQRWPSLFQTEHFRDCLETTAQANIARYSDSLREKGLGQDANCQA